MWLNETIKPMAYWYRRVLLLAFPLILYNLTQPLLSTVDTVLSGHLPGAAALGGVAVGGIFFNTIYWTFGFLRMGTTGLVAQAHGAQQHDQLRLHFLRALLSAVAIGALVLVVQGPLIGIAIRLLGASDAVAENARLYSHIRIWSAPAALTNFVLLGYLLGRQRARVPRWRGRRCSTSSMCVWRCSWCCGCTGVWPASPQRRRRQSGRAASWDWSWHAMRHGIPT